MSKEIVLKIDNLTKKFGELVAVNNISFEVRSGSFFAFLGRNGAGKSTTIRMITTLLKPDNGTYCLNGNYDENYIRENIGVVFQESILDGFLTVKENLLFRGNLYLKTKSEVEARYKEIREQFSLAEFENKQVRFLSGGQKRRVDIARALFNNPKVLFLDEPTTGLDPESRKIVWKILENLRKENKITIFLTTHYMEETNDADYVVIIDKGNIVASGTPTELKQTYAGDIFKVAPKNKTQFNEYMKNLKLPFKKIADQFVLNNVKTEDAIRIINENANEIKSFEMIKGTMDDVFINVVGEK